MVPIYGKTRSETWLKAVRHLMSCETWDDYNLVLEIKSPGEVTATDKVIDARVGSLLAVAGLLPINTVAETIFPASEYRRHGVRGVYEIYPNEIFPKIRPLLRWGTYAYRLLHREGRDGEPMNPLKILVGKLKFQSAKAKGMKRTCYELSLVGDDEEMFELPIFSAPQDQLSTFGGPCLSHISLKVTHADKLNMTVVYRSHFYMERALGNLLGLARLQRFICDETGLESGSLVCVSTYARLDKHKGAGHEAIEKLVNGLVEREAA